MLERFRNAAVRVTQEIRVYQLVCIDPRTPRTAKALLGLAIAYILSPVDLIPDWIPALGHLDDLIIVPVLVFLSLKMVPKSVIEDCRFKAKEQGA